MSRLPRELSIQQRPTAGIKRKRFRPCHVLSHVAAWVVLGVLFSSCSSDQPRNVILFIVDDLGWADTGVYGSSFYETPHIDQLAHDGIRFTNFYAASPVCSPTRASIMTGKHPARVDITNWIGGEQKGQLLPAEYKRELPLQEMTLAEHFRSAGYSTAFLGKWHLGSEGFLPEQQGFDINIGGHAAGQPGSYFNPYKHPNNEFWDVPGLDGGEEGEYLTDRLTDETIRYLRDKVADPFLIVLSYYNVHTPLQAKEEYVGHFEKKALESESCSEPLFTEEQYGALTRRCQNHPVYASMIQSTDESIGRIRQELSDLGLADNTAIVFVSDNGGLSTLANGRSNGPTASDPLRAGKGWLYEGGIRIPFIVSLPHHKGAGSVSRTPGMTTDIVETLTSIAGIEQQKIDGPDGNNLNPSVLDLDQSSDRPLYWHFPHYHGSGNRPSGAIREGPYKLIEWFEDGRVELYDLERDPSETTNIAEEYQELTTRLLHSLKNWREQIGANMPTPNPVWNADD